MHCFRCQAENVDGSRFCGNCGASFGTIPPSAEGGDEPALHVTDPTRQMSAGSAQASSGLPRLSKGGRPIVGEDAAMTGGSLGSLKLPVSTGARVIKVVLIVVLDLAMAGIGLMLLLSSDCGGADQAEKPAATVEVGDGAVAAVVVDAAGGGGGGGGAGSNLTGGGGGGSGGGAGSGGGGRGTGAGTGRGTGTGTGTGGGTGTGTGSGTGASTGPVDASVVSQPDAGTGSGTGTGTGTGTGAVDASVDSRPDADGEATVGADDIADQVGIQQSRSQGRLGRCYTQATKALPDDQPLSGEVDIGFVVMPTGEAGGVAVVRNTTGSNTLANCIAGVVGAWTFSRFDGEPIEFQRTFRFKPASQ